MLLEKYRQRDQNIIQNIKAADANGHAFHIGYF